MAETLKPLLLICSAPISGHIAPCKIIAKQLINRGYEVTFLTGTRFGPNIEAIGAAFVPLQGYCDFSDHPDDMLKQWPIRETLQGPAQTLADMENMFLNSMPSQFESIQRALKIMTERSPGRPIVLISELVFCGVFPLLMNAPGVIPTAVICIGISSIILSSQDTPPMGSGLPPDSSPDGRERNKAMHAEFQNGPFAGLNELFHDNFEKLSAQRPPTFFLDTPYILPDRFIQLCAEAPCVPFADRDDTIVIAALGVKGASLPDSFVIPENAYVADFIPFDEILPFCDVFVTNGGYGAFQHGLSNACPMVMGGDTEDKPENCLKCEWAGVGINLKTASPSVEFLRGKIERVFGDKKYKERVMEVMREMEGMDPIGVFEQAVEEVVREKIQKSELAG